MKPCCSALCASANIDALRAPTLSTKHRNVPRLHSDEKSKPRSLASPISSKEFLEATGQRELRASPMEKQFTQEGRRMVKIHARPSGLCWVFLNL